MPKNIHVGGQLFIILRCSLLKMNGFDYLPQKACFKNSRRNLRFLGNLPKVFCKTQTSEIYVAKNTRRNTLVYQQKWNSDKKFLTTFLEVHLFPIT